MKIFCRSDTDISQQVGQGFTDRVMKDGNVVEETHIITVEYLFKKFFTNRLQMHVRRAVRSSTQRVYVRGDAILMAYGDELHRSIGCEQTPVTESSTVKVV